MRSLPKNMEHVDRRELYTSLPARVDYLHTFLEFGPDDVVALVEGQRYIKMVIPAIVNMVYKKLLRHDVTARVFSTRDSRSDVDPDEWVSEEGSQIQNRKIFLRWYLTKLNSDPTNMEYWEYLDKVGAMHVCKGGRRNPLFVDYLFLGACLGYIQDSFLEAILSHPRLELTKKIAISKAITKVIWIQNDLIARWHMKDGDECQEASAEPENLQPTKLSPRVPGVNEDKASVHSSDSGKTSLGRTEEDVKMGNDHSVCPFSGMSGNQEFDMTKQRAPRHKSERDSNSNYFVSNSGIPRLQVVNGQVVGKEKLDMSILSEALKE